MISSGTQRASTVQPVLDETEALRRIGGDREVLLEVIEAFVESYKAGLSDIHKAILDGNREALAFAAHRSRGALSQLAAVAALQVVKRLEDAALRAPRSELQSLLLQYQAELDQLIPRLGAMLEDRPPHR